MASQGHPLLQLKRAWKCAWIWLKQQLATKCDTDQSGSVMYHPCGLGCSNTVECWLYLCIKAFQLGHAHERKRKTLDWVAVQMLASCSGPTVILALQFMNACWMMLHGTDVPLLFVMQLLYWMIEQVICCADAGFMLWANSNPGHATPWVPAGWCNQGGHLQASPASPH